MRKRNGDGEELHSSVAPGLMSGSVSSQSTLSPKPSSSPSREKSAIPRSIAEVPLSLKSRKKRRPRSSGLTHGAV